MFRPIKVIDVELSRPIESIERLDGYDAVLALVRLHGSALGCVRVPLTNQRCEAQNLCKAIREKLGWPLLRHLLNDGLSLSFPKELRLETLGEVPHPEPRAELPLITVAVCTRDPGRLLGPAYRPEALRDKAVWAMAEKVRITENEDYERQYPARSLARISIRLHSGVTRSLEIDRSELGRYLAPTDADIEDKFRLVATPVLGQAKTDKVVDLVQRIETLPDLDELMKALQPGGNG